MISSDTRLHTDGKSLCKFFNDFTYNRERVRNVMYFRENPIFPLKINYTYTTGDCLLGYNMEFIPGCVTFKDAVDDDSYTYDDMVKAINGVFSKLKLLHKSEVL